MAGDDVHEFGANAVEISARVTAANRGWKELHGTWFNRKVPRRVRRLCFIGAVQGAALSGLNGLILCRTDYVKLDRRIAK